MHTLEEGWLDDIIGGAKKVFGRKGAKEVAQPMQAAPVAPQQQVGDNRKRASQIANIWTNSEKVINKLAETDKRTFNAVVQYIRELAHAIQRGDRAAMEAVAKMEAGWISTPRGSSPTLRDRPKRSYPQQPKIDAGAVAHKYFPMIKELAKTNPERFLRFAEKLDTEHANRTYGSVDKKQQAMDEWEAKFLGKKYNPNKRDIDKYKDDPWVKSMIDNADPTLPEDLWTDDPDSIEPDMTAQDQEILNDSVMIACESIKDQDPFLYEAVKTVYNELLGKKKNKKSKKFDESCGY